MGISNQLQHGQAHELTKKHSSVISSQEVQFLNVVQEPVVAYTILGNTQKQPFTSLESTTVYASASSTHDGKSSLINQELIIAKSSCTTDMIYQDGVALELFPQSKAYFPPGDFFRATRSENKNPATWLVKIGSRKNSPRTSRKRSYFFVCSREQIRLVENGLNAQTAYYIFYMWNLSYDRFDWLYDIFHIDIFLPKV